MVTFLQRIHTEDTLKNYGAVENEDISIQLAIFQDILEVFHAYLSSISEDKSFEWSEGGGNNGIPSIFSLLASL